MNNLLRQIEQKYLSTMREGNNFKTHDEIEIGSTVRVHYKIKEGEKERVQVYEGVVLAKKKSKDNLNSMFTVRRVTAGFGMERTFVFNSPKIEKIEVTKRAIVRRAKLYFLRARKGKSARLKEKLYVSTAKASKTTKTST